MHFIVRAVSIRIVQIVRKAWKLVWWVSLTSSTFWPIDPKNRTMLWRHSDVIKAENLDFKKMMKNNYSWHETLFFISLNCFKHDNNINRSSETTKAALRASDDVIKRKNTVILCIFMIITADFFYHSNILTYLLI